MGVKREAAIDYAQAQPDLGAIWLSDHERVLNVTFADHLDKHRRAIRASYPGPLCAEPAPVTARALNDAQRRLHGDQDLVARGIHLLSSGQAKGKLDILVIAAKPAEIDLIQDQYGLGVVVTSWLRPLPGNVNPG